MGTVTQAYTWATNDVITAARLNANPAAFVAGFANIDRQNIGSAGIDASNIIPTTAAAATFGGSVPYTFQRQVNVNSGGFLTTNGSITVTALLTASNASPFSIGDLMAQRSAATGAIFLGGATRAAQIDFGVTGLTTQVTVLRAGGTDITLAAFGNVAAIASAGSVSFPGGVADGDIFAQRSASTGTVWLGGATAAACVMFGTGSPSGAVTAANGSLFMRYDGTHGGTTALYLNTSGASTVGTTWTAIG